jgi:two-component system response regulator GlrR
MEFPNTPAVDEVEATLAKVGLIGRSEAFRSTVQALRRLAAVDTVVLLVGATGTGKELVTRAIHYLSTRRGGPFIPVDCGALPESLFEGELFGHTRGAFTDARMDMRGLIAQAEGGTLFIDEIHTLSLRSQAATLRFLQDGAYRPLGASQVRRANVRIVAASNRSLEEGTRAGWFREDLFYRLDVATLHLPSLAERREDIPLLATMFLDRLVQRYGIGPCRFDAGTLVCLASRPWRGNVRELENFVHREFLRVGGPVIVSDGGDEATAAQADRPAPETPFNAARAEVLASFEVNYLRTLLAATGGNVSEAARRARKERRLFARMLKRHGIARDEFHPHRTR